MGHRHRKTGRAKSARQHRSVRTVAGLPRLAGADRRILLAGTALASTLLIAVIVAPTPAHAVLTCAGDVGTSPAPIDHTAINDSIDCVNTEVRTNAAGNTISLGTDGNDNPLFLDNSGTLTASNAGPVFGIAGASTGDNSDVDIVNSGDITATSTGSFAWGIVVGTNGTNSSIDINNSGVITTSAAGNAYGIRGAKFTDSSSIDISNNGAITATSTGGLALGIDVYSTFSDHAIGVINSGDVAATAQGANAAYGVRVFAGGDDSPVTINNSGDVVVNGDTGETYGIFVRTNSQDSDVDVVNTGDVTVTSNANTAYGIYIRGYGTNSDVTINNEGDLTLTGRISAGILSRTFEPNTFLSVENSGDITSTGAVFASSLGGTIAGQGASVRVENSGDITSNSAFFAFSIFAAATGTDASVTLDNSGDVTTTAPSYATSLRAYATAGGSSVALTNSGTITSTSAGTATALDTETRGPDSSTSINNSGDLIATGDTGDAAGIYALAGDGDSPISIVNSGDITANGGANADGIDAVSQGVGSGISINNSGDLAVTGSYSNGLYALVYGADSAVDIVNNGDITVAADGGRPARGIRVLALDSNSSIDIVNNGDITATGFGAAGGFGNAITVLALGADSAINIVNTGDIAATGTSVFLGGGIFAFSQNSNSSIDIVNTGDITAISANSAAYGIYTRAYGANSNVSVDTAGDMSTTGQRAIAVFARTVAADTAVTVSNRGNLVSTGVAYAAGIRGIVDGAGSSVSIDSAGDITASSGLLGYGIIAAAAQPDSSVAVVNSGDVTVTGNALAVGISASTAGGSSPVSVINSGDITAQGDGDAVGILALADAGSPVRVVNSGNITGDGGGRGGGIVTIAPLSAVEIENSGSLRGSYAGIYSMGGIGTTIVNSGRISASSQRAIIVSGTGNADIQNAGTIIGFVDLTEQADMFVNQSGGLFDARLTSEFRGGTDLFTNETGGTVRALNIGSTGTRFNNLERFENRGTISMVDGAEGDSFTISNTVGGTDLEFVAGSGSTLAVDAFLGGPGSTSDIFTIEGNVSGRTELTVNNTNPGPGALNTVGIPVVFATGETPDAGAFFLEQPIDTGFFDYDLFFVPTGSGFWELRNFIGGGAQLLPQLLTAAQDIWHQGSSVWFDRSADLRVLLANGNAPAVNLGSKSLGKSLSVPQNDGITPAVWVRGSGSWLDREDSGSTNAFGRNYRFDLDRDLTTMDFQMGLDLGTRDLLSQGDILVFGMLGGYVHGDLDYDSLGRQFDFTGGQVGAYATYLKGGLFVDTLLNVHLTELDANGALGFPNNDLDANTLGLRTDAGYRFGSFSGGAFLEPLATIEVTWADVDGFNVGGNSVKFDDDANVRGRLGLRAGTTMEAWEDTRMEPFVTGSLWGTLSGDNQATLVSGGSSFLLEDQLDDVWGEVSAGVNFFNFSQTTSVFAKVDVTFGDDVSGAGGKAGMRVAW